MMKIVIVGFRMDEENSRHYEKFEVEDTPTSDERELIARALLRCVQKGSHAASVRFVKKALPE